MVEFEGQSGHPEQSEETPKTNLRGSIVPLITPRDDRFFSQIDVPGLGSLLRYQIAAGTDGIFILGTTGEFQKLTPNQKRIVIETSVEVVNGQVPVVVGVSASTPSEIAEITRFSQENGASAVVIAPLYGASDASHLQAARDSTDLPVVLYNNPAIHGGVSFRPDTFNTPDLSKFSGIKDSSSDFAVFSSWLNLRSEAFRVFAGTYPSFIFGFEHGGIDGWVLAEANFSPENFSSRTVTPDGKTMERQALNGIDDIRIRETNFIPITKQRVYQKGVTRTPDLFA